MNPRDFVVHSLFVLVSNDVGQSILMLSYIAQGSHERRIKLESLSGSFSKRHWRDL